MHVTYDQRSTTHSMCSSQGTLEGLPASDLCGDGGYILILSKVFHHQTIIVSAAVLDQNRQASWSVNFTINRCCWLSYDAA